MDYEATLPEKTAHEVRDRLFEEFQSDAEEAFEHLDTIVRLHFSSWSLLPTAAALLLLLLHETKDGLDDIIALLGSNAESDISSTPLLAEAHFVSGDTEAAKGMFQRMLANGVNLILASPPFLTQLMPDDNEAAIADCGALAVQCQGVVYIRMVTDRDGSRMP